MRIMLAIYPDAPRHMLLHALLHDVGEVATGDLPFPTKLRNPELKKIMDSAEHTAHLRMCLGWGLPPPCRNEMTPTEAHVFKIADYIEMWEWGLDELAMGNVMAIPVSERCAAEVARLLDLDLTTDAVRENAVRYLKRRYATNGSYGLSNRSK